MNIFVFRTIRINNIILGGKINKKKLLVLIIAFITAVATVVVGVYAANIEPNNPVIITDAIKAGDVCEEHLEQYCTICDGDSINSNFYRTICPFCNINTTRCCSRECAKDNYYEKCLVMSHPKGCNTVQDLYWNAYICIECGWYTRGTRIDDYHVEAYWHPKEPSCADNAYCKLPTLDDLRAIVNQKLEAELMSVSDNNETVQNTPHDPVAAGDYCDVHGIFECNIPHNDVE